MPLNENNPEFEVYKNIDKKKYDLDIKDAEKVGGIIERVSVDVKDVFNNKFVKKGVYRILDKVDENYMDTMRNIWAKTPDEVKWAVMYMPALFKANPALLHLMPLHILVKCGLLDYPEESIAKSAGLEKKVLEYGIKYGKYIEPALAALEPLIAPIKRIIDLEEEFFAGMRNHLQTKRRAGGYREAA